MPARNRRTVLCHVVKLDSLNRHLAMAIVDRAGVPYCSSIVLRLLVIAGHRCQILAMRAVGGQISKNAARWKH